MYLVVVLIQPLLLVLMFLIGQLIILVELILLVQDRDQLLELGLLLVYVKSILLLFLHLLLQLFFLVLDYNYARLVMN